MCVKLAAVMWESFIARFDLTQIFMNLFIAAISGLLGGKFGVRRALEQARKERAFDRSLEWHESTLRATNKFRFLSRRYSETLLERGGPFNRDRGVTEFAKQLEECASDLEKALFEAVLFAEKETVGKLRLAAQDLADMIPLAANVAVEFGVSGENEFKLLSQLRSLEEVAVAIHVELVQGIRKQLGLDELTASDLGLGPEPSRSELIRGYLLYRVPFVAKMFPRMFPERREATSNGMKDEVTKA